jgi:hypothetical protein
MDREFLPRRGAPWRAAEWARWRSAVDMLLGTRKR